ncbi:hypothetical protein [Amnibacterium endophyticum]|uniref:Uncharacterized protein n=1 Tax=Amnibacterium endophyticum TaxID=2109337 RepID=A0ABW4LH53_9MICO
MPTMHALQDERAQGTAQRFGELPALSTVDRVALRLGLALILWGQQHAERQELAATAQRNRAAERASADVRDALERRAWSGPTW